MQPVINTEKHIVQESLFTVASGAVGVREIVFAKAAPVATTPSEVREGSVIKAVYVEMWITSDDATQGTAIVTLERVPGGASSITAGSSASLNSYANKKNVLHTFMGLVPPNTQYPTAAVKGWFKIPKGKQRFGISDRLHLNVHGQSNGLQGCGFFVYKEQY